MRWFLPAYHVVDLDHLILVASERYYGVLISRLWPLCCFLGFAVTEVPPRLRSMVFRRPFRHMMFPDFFTGPLEKLEYELHCQKFSPIHKDLFQLTQVSHVRFSRTLCNLYLADQRIIIATRCRIHRSDEPFQEWRPQLGFGYHRPYPHWRSWYSWGTLPLYRYGFIQIFSLGKQRSSIFKPACKDIYHVNKFLYEVSLELWYQGRLIRALKEGLAYM